MPFTSAVRDSMLDQLNGLATHASIHTADPGTSGASEVSGGSYARQAITWQAPSGGSKTIVGTATFQIPGGTTITHSGTWSALTSGTWRGGGALSASEVYSAAGGTYTLTLTATAT
ncbi:MAG: Phage protein [Streptosporangiaceae bacterium]|nr:Phage protein [Streptosporangiaceae bacterium]